MRFLLAICALIIAAPAAKAQALTLADCEAGWQRLQELGGLGTRIETTAPPVLSENGACVLEQLRFAQGYVGWEADRLAWSGRGFDDSRLPGLPLIEMTFLLRGLRTVAAPDDPVLHYLMRLQQARNGIDIAFAARWDHRSGVIALDRFEVDFPGANQLVVTARVEGADADNLLRRDMAGTELGLTDLTVEIESNGLFETYAVVFGPALLDGAADPAARVEELKGQAIAALGTVPEAILDADSRTALVMAVRALPAPSGTLRVALSSQDGLGPADAVELLAAGATAPDLRPLWSVLDGTRIDATYTPTPAAA